MVNTRNWLELPRDLLRFPWVVLCQFQDILCLVTQKLTESMKNKLENFLILTQGLDMVFACCALTFHWESKMHFEVFWYITKVALEFMYYRCKDSEVHFWWFHDKKAKHETAENIDFHAFHSLSCCESLKLNYWYSKKKELTIIKTFNWIRQRQLKYIDQAQHAYYHSNGAN